MVPNDAPTLFLTPGETYTMRFWDPKFYDGGLDKMPSIANTRDHNYKTGAVEFKPNPYKLADDYYLRCRFGTIYGIPEDIHVHVSPTPEGTKNSIKFTVPKDISVNEPIMIIAGPEIKDGSSLKPWPWGATTRCSIVGPMTISAQDPRFSDPPQVVHTFDTVETNT